MVWLRGVFCPKTADPARRLRGEPFRTFPPLLPCLSCSFPGRRLCGSSGGNEVLEVVESSIVCLCKLTMSCMELTTRRLTLHCQFHAARGDGNWTAVPMPWCRRRRELERLMQKEFARRMNAGCSYAERVPVHVCIGELQYVQALRNILSRVF